LRDELSGLYNRRGFLELSRQQLRLAARGQRGACLFFADLNGMKAINDGLGHEMGDRALASMASLLAGVFRDSDIVARLGGDEFAVLAADCDGAGTTVLRARVQAAVQNFNALSSEPFQLSISVGAALFDPAHPVELEALMEAADAKMYEEKRVRSRSGSALAHVASPNELLD
jgi:diguanylate cyclase (GGDEF)-like protein